MPRMFFRRIFSIQKIYGFGFYGHFFLRPNFLDVKKDIIPINTLDLYFFSGKVVCYNIKSLFIFIYSVLIID